MTDEATEQESPYSDRRITLPSFGGVENPYDYQNEIDDYESIERLSSAINAARRALFEVTDKLNELERKEVSAKLAYERAYKREYLNLYTVKPEAARKITAELKCEKLENKYLSLQQLKNEYYRISNTIRIELQSYQGIGNNLRQQLKI